MRGSIRLFKIAGISINVHITFILLLLFFMYGGIKALFLITAIFCFVTLHELSHSLVAQKFGIKVKEITLLPIGGVASMSKMTEKPSEEFLISIAGPLLNIFVVLIFYFPLYLWQGPEKLFSFFTSGPSLATWPHVVIYIYWVNLILAAFNLIPAFPMDGGRILRSILAQRMSFRRATKIAVNFGHIFALLFGYFGLMRGHIFLIIIAIFIYMAASSEGMQVDVRETLKKFTVKDVISRQFLTLQKDATLAKVLELVFHSHQEDFPIVEEDSGRMIGFVTRKDIINGLHQRGTSSNVESIMRKKFPTLRESDFLTNAQNVMREHNVRALPVLKLGRVIGVITIEDITRVYSVMAERK